MVYSISRGEAAFTTATKETGKRPTKQGQNSAQHHQITKGQYKEGSTLHFCSLQPGNLLYACRGKPVYQKRQTFSNQCSVISVQ
jgi:hypothetical protein